VVYADDIVWLCKSKQESTNLYFELLNHLHSIALDINKSKVQQGRYASGVLDFIGYRFAGGNVGISPDKVSAFKEDFAWRCERVPKPFNERVYIKNLNSKISGFGHYYKCAHVVGIFEKLDSYIRGQIRQQYKVMGLSYPSNAHFERMGLCSLYNIKRQKKQALVPKVTYDNHKEQSLKKHRQKTKEDILHYYLEHFDNQHKQIIGLLSKLAATQEEMLKHF